MYVVSNQIFPLKTFSLHRGVEGEGGGGAGRARAPPPDSKKLSTLLLYSTYLQVFT